MNKLTFRIDPRIELFNIIAMQAGHHQMTLSNIPYKQQCLNYFSAFKEHEATALLRQTWRNGWGVDDPIFFMLRLDDDLNLGQIANQGMIKRGGGDEHLNRLAAAIKDFAEKSKFQSFFNDMQQDFYRQVLSHSAYSFRDLKIIDHMVNYYGEECDSYNLVMNLNGGYGNFGTSHRSADRTDLYAVVETSTRSGDLPTYHPSIGTVDLIVHEFSHGFVNPAVEPFQEQYSKNGHLYEPIKQSMRHQGYWSWSSCAVEHFVFAAVTRITEKCYGREYADSTFYKLTMARRLIYIDAIIEELKVYEASRDRYPSFADFAPELVRCFDTVTPSYIEDRQKKVEGIRHTHIERIPKPHEYAKSGDTYFILGTHEDDEVQQRLLHEYVQRFRDNVAEEIKIISDDEALVTDLANSDIVVFGTPSGNTFLQEHIGEIPIKIADEYIITNRRIEGDNLQLVTSWVNPFNDGKLMTIYTAQRVGSIKGFTSSRARNIFHYWVGEGFLTLDRGDYAKYSRVWMPKIY